MRRVIFFAGTRTKVKLPLFGSLTAGMRPLGFILRYHGSFCSFFRKLEVVNDVGQFQFFEDYGSFETWLNDFLGVEQGAAEKVCECERDPSKPKQSKKSSSLTLIFRLAFPGSLSKLFLLKCFHFKFGIFFGSEEKLNWEQGIWFGSATATAQYHLCVFEEQKK